MALAGVAIQSPGDLGLKLGPCGENVCVDWVMPSGHAWSDGARPGMRVITLNSQDARLVSGSQPLREAELLSPDGRSFLARTTSETIVLPWIRGSLWLTGSLFVLLGALVLLRRPDAIVARLFAVFTGMTGVALGVSPASGGPHPAWSLAVQFVSLLGVAGSLLPFATAFMGDPQGARFRLRLSCFAGVSILIGYLFAIIFYPSFYGVVRIAFTIYFVGNILAALFLLARRMWQHSPASKRDARLALTGIACGTLPFVGLTLVPQMAVHEEIVPAHLTAILWAVIPLAFAYAILRHQTLGIRRLVHRGMVHGVAALGTLVVVFLLVVAVDSALESVRAANPAWTIAVLVALGAVLFHFLSKGARRLVDRLWYQEDVDSGTLLASMRNDLVGSAQVEEVVAAMVRKLQESLQLEAAILFLGTTAETMRVAAKDGIRADETIAYARSRLLGMDLGELGVTEARWSSDALLVARLETGGHPLGVLVLGPKEKGEIFLREERRLVETIAPILALAIRETGLVAELREVSERLTDAQEAERGRLARDLHDGPLQKAILLGGGADVTLRDRNGVARELAAELRELCARLRPAILDDLGLVPALEWLLEKTAQGFTVTPHLTLRGMSEDDRLAPNTELALFRVTQEAVSNALKHGHPRSIHVLLAKTLDGIELSIADDGNGAVFAGGPMRGLGIPGMRERLRQVGGSVSIASDAATGTMVSAYIPYEVQREQ